MDRIRSRILAVVFAVAAGAAMTGLTLTSESRETDLNITCQMAVWPDIPEQCLAGVVHEDVRVIAIDNHDLNPMPDRFVVAFGPVANN